MIASGPIQECGIVNCEYDITAGLWLCEFYLLQLAIGRACIIGVVVKDALVGWCASFSVVVIGFNSREAVQERGHCIM